jgi:putative ABC transport system substrate-binding protein
MRRREFIGFLGAAWTGWPSVVFFQSSFRVGLPSHRLPAIYEFDTFVRDGGLMSYGPDQDESLGRVAGPIERIFNGAKPAELPFEQPRRVRLAINVKVARALNLDLPPTSLACADEAIE